MPYFLDNKINVFGNKNLRLPQIEAYIKLIEFFEDNESGEALVILPTGTGKSGLISIAPYAIAKNRVLVITPGLVTKKSVVKSLHPLEDNFWINYDVIFDPIDLPIVEEYEPEMLYENLEKCNFVIANIHKLSESSNNSLLSKVPTDFFDIIIVDEAHHSPANTWVNALNYFRKAKKIHLTATPYRYDGQKIPGEKIHETPLSEVMRLKYVKWLRKMTVNNSEMYFTIPGNPSKLTKAEVLEYKEDEWIKRSIALSYECSLEVIRETIKRLKEIKELSANVPHKILAVACSILHANNLAKWYEENGMNVTIVHSKLERKILEENLLKVENHECDVVVSVNMLMEGYDHKYLTVLGIFRPYKSENAFAQIVGRVLRAIPDNEITDFAIDNNAYVIYHEETGLNVLWERFYKEVEKGKKLLTRDYKFTEREYITRTQLYGKIEVSNAYTSAVESYLPDIDFNEYFEEARKKIDRCVEKRMGELDTHTLSEVEKEAIKQIFRKTELGNSKLEIDALLVEKRPEKARREIRQILYKNANEAVQDILAEKGIDPKSSTLYSKFSKQINICPTDHNDGILVRYINTKVSKRYGSVKNRNNERLLQSEKYMQEVIQEVIKMI